MVTSACWAGPWTAGRLRAPGVGTARGHGAGFQGAPPPAPCPCGVGGSISREGCGPSPAEGSPQTPRPGEGCVQSEPSTARVGGPGPDAGPRCPNPNRPCWRQLPHGSSSYWKSLLGTSLFSCWPHSQKAPVPSILPPSIPPSHCGCSCDLVLCLGFNIASPGKPSLTAR